MIFRDLGVSKDQLSLNGNQRTMWQVEVCSRGDAPIYLILPIS